MRMLSVEEYEKITKIMKEKYALHKKVMVRTWLFILLYTAFIFVIFAQFVHDDMFVDFDLFFVEIGYDLWGAFWLLTIIYLFFLNIKLSVMKLSGDKIDAKILVNSLRNYYFLFNFFLIWPALFTALLNSHFLGNFGKILLGISPILLYILRIFVVNFLGSDELIRGLFRSKDVDIWSCPCCHEYILRKPNFYCPNCGNLKHGEKGFCASCGLSSKVDDFDFPNFCPHCGVGFKYSRLKKHV